MDNTGIEPETGYSLRLMGKDEEFAFKCARCGKCCTGIKESVALEALDIFRISRYFKHSGCTDWMIDDFLPECTTMIPITEFGYPMFFLNVTGPDASCVFLKSGRCGIQNAKPRTCRIYPMTMEPEWDGYGFNYYLIDDRNHRFADYAGPSVKAGQWMAENLSAEDIAFTQAELSAIPEIGRIMKRNLGAGVSIKTMLEWILFFTYFNYDVERPFMQQYQTNTEMLISILRKLNPIEMEAA